MNGSDKVTFASTTSSSEDLSTVPENRSSVHDGCIRVVFSEMEFLPWDNPDNIINEEVEAIIHQIHNNLVVLLFLIGGPANLINMAVFYKHGLRDRVNLCLFALSLADEIYVTSSVIFHGEQLYLQFTSTSSNDMIGPVFVFLAGHNVLVLLASFAISPLLSTILAVERCLCVFNPLRFQTLLRTRTMAAIISIISIVSTGLYFIVVHRYRFGCMFDPETGEVLTTTVQGTFYKAHKELIEILHGYVFGVGLAGLETIVVIVATVMTIVKLREIAKWRSGTASFISAKELALTKILVGSSILFLICTSPSALIRFSRLLLPEVSSGGRGHNFYLVSLWLTNTLNLFNSSFNFFIYYIMGSRYRETFWSLFGRKTKTTEMLSGEK